MDTILNNLAQLLVPEFADGCVVHSLEADGSIGAAAIAHKDPNQLELAHELQARYPPHPVPLVLRTGQPVVYPEIPESLLAGIARDEDHLSLLRQIGARSVLIAPMTARGRTFGTVSWVATSARSSSTRTSSRASDSRSPRRSPTCGASGTRAERSARRDARSAGGAAQTTKTLAVNYDSCRESRL